jgi:hypothetical protein
MEEMSNHHERRRRPLTIAETSERLRVSPYVTRKAIKDGILDAITLGPRTVRVLPESVERLLAGEKPDPV